MSTKLFAAAILVLFVASLCTLAYALGDAWRWLRWHWPHNGLSVHPAPTHHERRT